MDILSIDPASLGLIVWKRETVNGQDFIIYVPLDNGKVIEGDTPHSKEIESGN